MDSSTMLRDLRVHHMRLRIEVVAAPGTVPLLPAHATDQRWGDGSGSMENKRCDVVANGSLAPHGRDASLARQGYRPRQAVCVCLCADPCVFSFVCLRVGGADFYVSRCPRIGNLMSLD
jgi:hypothetical protein